MGSRAGCTCKGGVLPAALVVHGAALLGAYSAKISGLGQYFWGLVGSVAFVLVLVLHTYLKGPYYNLLDGYLGIIGMIWAFAIVWWLEKVKSRLQVAGS